MPNGSRNIHAHRTFGGALARLMDAGCIVWSLYLAVQFSYLPNEQFALVASIAVALYYLMAEVTGIYRSWRGEAGHRETLAILATWSGTLIALLTLGFLTKFTAEFSRSAILVWFLAAPLLITSNRVLTRAIQRWLHAKGLNTRTCAIIGVTELGVQLARNIEDSPEMGLRLVGFFDDRPEERTADLPSSVGDKIGDLEHLFDRARKNDIDRIYITFPMRAEDRIRQVLAQFGDTTASVYVVPDFFVFELLHSRWSTIGGLPAVSVTETPFYGAYGLLKRLSDLVLACLILTIVALPMVVISLLIKITSRGPIFFRQRRYGLDGREILVWKFRSMTVCDDGENIAQATRNDQRITSLGALLRKTSLDELPQLFNVLAGSMSLVGPRPHATAHNEEYRSLIPGYMLRHKVKPGITGLAQVEGWRGETDTLEKMENRIACDHDYIRQWSLWMDMKILFRTIFVVLSRKNAY